MTASLTLTYGALNLTATPYLIEFGLDTGAPQNVYETLALLLQDGEVELSDRASNRTVQFNVLIEGASLTAMATAEAALIAETERPLNTLTIDPGDGAPAGVYETYRGQVTLVRDDDWELGRLRRYTVTVRAMPFVRSATETVTAALAATGSTTTLLDACSATTGWTGFVDGGAVTPATSGGAVTLTATLTKGSHTYALQKTFAATTTSTKLLAVIWTAPAGRQRPNLVAIGDSVNLPLIAELPSGTAGKIKSWFYVAATSLAVTRIEWTGYADVPGSSVFSIDNIDVTDVNPIIGTGRQQQRSLMVGGSAPAPATLVLESATAALGDALLYVYDADESTIGYAPAMRQFRSSGNTVSGDAAQVSGSTEALNATPVAFQVPVSSFPRGSYLLLVRMKSAAGGAATITYDIRTILGGSGIAVYTNSATVTTTTSYQIFTLARFSLPTVDVAPDSPALMQLRLTTAASPAVTYDEVWLFNTTIGSLDRVDCGTGAGAVGGAARRLFVTPPTTLTPRPLIRIGHSADGSDSYFPTGTVTSWGVPRFEPPKVHAFAVTPGATDATLRMANYNRWHTNPAS